MVINNQESTLLVGRVLQMKNHFCVKFQTMTHIIEDAKYLFLHSSRFVVYLRLGGNINFKVQNIVFVYNSLRLFLLKYERDLPNKIQTTGCNNS